MNAAILTEDDLRLASGYRDRASLGRWTPFRAEHLCYVMRDLP